MSDIGLHLPGLSHCQTDSDRRPHSFRSFPHSSSITNDPWLHQILSDTIRPRLAEPPRRPLPEMESSDHPVPVGAPTVISRRTYVSGMPDPLSAAHG
jgi:hypothetical protein